MDVNLEEWQLVISNGIMLVGKYIEDEDVLRPVLQVHQPPTPHGVGLGVLPFISMTGIQELPVPGGSIRIPLLPSFQLDAKHWKAHISRALEAQAKARAQASGLTLVGR